MQSFDRSGSRYAGLEEFFDGSIISEDGSQFPIHRVILASASRYFRVQLQGNLNGGLQDDVFVSTVTGETLEMILSYIYKDKVRMTSDNIADLLMASDYLMMDDFVVECCAALNGLLSPSNCIELLNVAHLLSHLNMYDTCLRYAQTHFSLAMGDSEARVIFLRQLSFEPFQRLLESDLNVDDEDLVWQVIVEWTSMDPQQRLTSVPALLLLVRLEGASEELIQSIAAHPYVRDNKHCSHLNLQLKDIKDSLLSESPELRLQSRQASKRFLCVTKNEEGGIDVVISFDDQLTDGKWCTLGRKRDFAPTFVYAVGHHVITLDESTPTSCFEFDLLKKTWLELPPMNEVRRDYLSVGIEDSIYCIGGNEGPIFTVERYLPAERRWANICPMPDTVRSLHSARSLDGHIYARVVMHSAQRGRLANSYMYNPQTDSWANTYAAPSETRKGWPGIDFQGILFLFGEGGSNGVWRFNHRAKSWSWDHRQQLPGQHYHSPKAKIIDGDLVVFETDGVHTSLPKLRWVPDTDQWEEVSVDEELCGSELFEIEDAAVNRALRSVLTHETWVNRF